jgi:oxygen-independent coproporphyrinogen-3 oxidase
MAGAPLSLYVHIPFCSLKCAYCDFNSYAGIGDLIPSFADALVNEIETWAPIAEGRPVKTVFFGGGTPTLMPPESNARVLDAIRSRFAVADGAEISIEANPGTVDEAHLRALVAAGFNRISFGVQSFDDSDLAFLDRVHSASDAEECVRWSRTVGFQRVSIDLIYGLPGQSLGSWADKVDRALALEPGHISAYALTIEDGTRLAYDVNHGRVPEPDPDLQADMYEHACARLALAGYRQYEISNWARPGQECRHNLQYWRNGEWLGMGPGAHSHWGGFRFANVYSPRRYLDTAATPESTDTSPAPADVLRRMPQVAFSEPQPRGLQVADTAILALRLNEGLDLTEFEGRFGETFESAFPGVMDDPTLAALLERTGERVRLTARGRLLANEVFVRLLPGSAEPVHALDPVEQR